MQFYRNQIKDLSTTTAFQGNFQHGENQLETTTVKRDTVDWHQKFSQYFTPTVVATEDSYTSPNLSIHITHGNYDSGLLDTTADGKHEKYGTQIAYTIADVYVGDITCFQTAFAQNIYGNGYNEKLSDMASRLDAVLSVNGDSYNNNRHQNNGTIIRNGVIYRSQRTDMETCVLNWDGSMEIYFPQELNTQTLIDRGAYQSWVFGPSLLDQNGKFRLVQSFYGFFGTFSLGVVSFMCGDNTFRPYRCCMQPLRFRNCLRKTERII